MGVIKIFMILLLSFSSLFGDKLEDVKSKKILKAGVKHDFKPFGFKNEKGEVVGFDIDLLQYIADNLGVKLKLMRVTSKTRIPMVKAGMIDIAAASMTHTVERDVPIDFSQSYFYDGQSILVRSDSKATSYKDFLVKKVAAIKGATSGSNFATLQPSALIIYYDNYDQALSALKAGLVEAVTTDFAWCSTQANDSEGKLKVIGGTLTFEPYGMGVAENESNFRDAINLAIQQSVKDGTYEKLYIKWFGIPAPKLPEVWP
jgi:polar amino acid transport system substrate-binding protein